MDRVKLLRLGISIELILLIVGGLVLAYIPGTRISPVGVLQQQNLCDKAISRTLNPHHDFSISCPVSRDGWADLSLASTLPLGLEVSFSGQSGGAPILLYNQSGTQIIEHIPFFSTGSVMFKLTNDGNTTTLVTGSVSTSTLKNVTGYIRTTIYPYRTRALALVGVSGILLFIVAWDPRGITTSTLRRIIRWEPGKDHTTPAEAGVAG